MIIISLISYCLIYSEYKYYSDKANEFQLKNEWMSKYQHSITSLEDKPSAQKNYLFSGILKCDSNDYLFATKTYQEHEVKKWNDKSTENLDCKNPRLEMYDSEKVITLDWQIIKTDLPEEDYIENIDTGYFGSSKRYEYKYYMKTNEMYTGIGYLKESDSNIYHLSQVSDIKVDTYLLQEGKLNLDQMKNNYIGIYDSYIFWKYVFLTLFTFSLILIIYFIILGFFEFSSDRYNNEYSYRLITKEDYNHTVKSNKTLYPFHLLGVLILDIVLIFTILMIRYNDKSEYTSLISYMYCSTNEDTIDVGYCISRNLRFNYFNVLYDRYKLGWIVTSLIYIFAKTYFLLHMDAAYMINYIIKDSTLSDYVDKLKKNKPIPKYGIDCYHEVKSGKSSKRVYSSYNRQEFKYAYWNDLSCDISKALDKYKLTGLTVNVILLFHDQKTKSDYYNCKEICQNQYKNKDTYYEEYEELQVEGFINKKGLACRNLEDLPSYFNETILYLSCILLTSPFYILFWSQVATCEYNLYKVISIKEKILRMK